MMTGKGSSAFGVEIGCIPQRKSWLRHAP